jgi:hypothetical protein
MDTPTIVTRTPFAKTRKEATPAPVRMAIVIWTLTTKLEQSVRKSTSVSIPLWMIAMNETQVCVDLPPPSKWQCVERTPAPTPVVEAFCYNDHQTGMSPDTGCTDATPFCAASPGKGGNRCVACIDDTKATWRQNPDSGCDNFWFLKDLRWDRRWWFLRWMHRRQARWWY